MERGEREARREDPDSDIRGRHEKKQEEEKKEKEAEKQEKQTEEEKRQERGWLRREYYFYLSWDRVSLSFILASEEPLRIQPNATPARVTYRESIGLRCKSHLPW